MRDIKFTDLVLELVFTIVFAVSLVAGVFFWPFFILAAGALAAYFVWNRKFRCPYCGGQLDPGKLLRAAGGCTRCPFCGGEIYIARSRGRE